MANTRTVNRGNLDKVKYMYIGQVFKSYRDVCKFLDADVAAGGSKNYQLEEWGKYFKWERDKNRWIIVEIYKKPCSEAPIEHKVTPYPKEFDLTSIVISKRDKIKAVQILLEHGIKIENI